MAEPPQLSEHRPHACDLETQPLLDLQAFRRVLATQCSVLISQISQDHCRFKQRHAVGAIDQDRDFSVRVEGQEVRRFLLALVQIDRGQGVVEAEFFEGDGDFLAVGSVGRVQVQRGSIHQRFRPCGCICNESALFL